MCGRQEETRGVMVWSQGKMVCPDCKKSTQGSDDRAFDKDMYMRRFKTGDSFDNLLP